MRPKRILLIAVAHFVVSRILFLWVFGRGMQQLDTGRSLTVFETATDLVSRALDFPLSLALGLVPRGWLPGLIGYVPFAINSLIWGVVVWFVVSRLINGKPEIMPMGSV